MEGDSLIFFIFAVTYVVLTTILFFKIWAMTNSIKYLTFFYMHEKGIALDRKRKAVDGRFLDKEGKEIRLNY